MLKAVKIQDGNFNTSSEGFGEKVVVYINITKEVENLDLTVKLKCPCKQTYVTNEKCPCKQTYVTNELPNVIKV